VKLVAAPPAQPAGDMAESTPRGTEDHFSVRCRYRAFGARTDISGMPPARQDPSFQNRTFDAGLGIYDYRNRSFDPATGRFLQRDPVMGGDELFNPYCFPGNNPVANTDSLGTGQPNDSPIEPKLPEGTTPTAVDVKIEVMSREESPEWKPTTKWGREAIIRLNVTQNKAPSGPAEEGPLSVYAWVGELSEAQITVADVSDLSRGEPVRIYPTTGKGEEARRSQEPMAATAEAKLKKEPPKEKINMGGIPFRERSSYHAFAGESLYAAKVSERTAKVSTSYHERVWLSIFDMAGIEAYTAAKGGWVNRRINERYKPFRGLYDIEEMKKWPKGTYHLRLPISVAIVRNGKVVSQLQGYVTLKFELDEETLKQWAGTPWEALQPRKMEVAAIEQPVQVTKTLPVSGPAEEPKAPGQK
jgi:RHS repeat-associated protein